jgi:polygalacturonase
MRRSSSLVLSFGLAMIALAPSPAVAATIVVASPNDTSDSRQTIQNALDQVEAAGGGIVQLIDGDFYIGRSDGYGGDDGLQIGSNTHLKMDPDVVLIRRFHGQGTEAGATIRNKEQNPDPDADPPILPNENIRVSGGTIRTQVAAAPGNGGKHIGFAKANSVAIDDVRFRHVEGNWNVYFHDCNDVSITRLDIVSGTRLFEDGIHVTGGRRIVIADCNVECGDDCIAFNVDPNQDAGEFSDIVVSNCTLHSHVANGIRLLVDAPNNETIRRVQISNVVIKTGPQPAMPDPRELPAGIQINNRNTGTYQISDVQIDGVQIDASKNANDGLMIEGAERVRLSRVVITKPLWRTRIDASRDIELLDCVIDDPRENGEGLEQPCLLVAGAGPCTDIRILGGLYRNAKQHGIQLGSASHAVTKFQVSNALIDNQFGAGLHLFNATDGIVSGINVRSGDKGIQELSPSTRNLFIGNFLADNASGLEFNINGSSQAIRNVAPDKNVQDSGGFRDNPDGWYLDNVAANLTNRELERNGRPVLHNRFLPVRAGSITGVVVSATEDLFQDTSLTVEVYRTTGSAPARSPNPGVATGLTATIPAGGRRAFATQREGLDTFLPGDEITIVVTTPSNFNPTTVDINAAVLIAQ